MAGAFAAHFVNLIVPTSTVANLRLDGAPIAPPPVWQAHPTPGLVWASIPLPANAPPTGHLLTNTKRDSFAVTYYGWAEYDSYGHPGDMRWGDLPPEIHGPTEVTVQVQDGPNGPYYIVPDLVGGAAPLVTATDDCTPADQITLEQTPPAGTSSAYSSGLSSFPILVVADDGTQTTRRVITARLVDSWEIANFTAPVVAQPELEATVWGAYANPDGDPYPNVLEEVFGTDPNEPNFDPLLQFTVVPNTTGVTSPVPGEDGIGPGKVLRVTFRRRLILGELDLDLQGGSDLASWDEGSSIFREDVDERLLLPGGEFIRLSFDVLPSIWLPSYFVRARITGP
jgi:hypothetical protein